MFRVWAPCLPQRSSQCLLAGLVQHLGRPIANWMPHLKWFRAKYGVNPLNCPSFMLSLAWASVAFLNWHRTDVQSLGPVPSTAFFSMYPDTTSSHDRVPTAPADRWSPCLRDHSCSARQAWQLTHWDLHNFHQVWFHQSPKNLRAS